MNPSTKLKLESFSAWSGVVFSFAYIALWTFLAELQPPLSYSSTPEQAADFYLSRQQNILLGMAMCAVVGGLWMTFAAQVTVVLWRIEGEGPVFTIAHFIGQVLTNYAWLFTPIIWMIPAFRADGDPQVIRAFSDFAYLTFNGTFIVTTVPFICSGVIALNDSSEHPVFPRWAGWVFIYFGLSLFLVVQTPFVMTGPLALEGWLAGWIPGLNVFLWIWLVAYFMIKDVNRRKRVLLSNPAHR
jgi:hypothetical protein